MCGAPFEFTVVEPLSLKADREDMPEDGDDKLEHVELALADAATAAATTAEIVTAVELGDGNGMGATPPPATLDGDTDEWTMEVLDSFRIFSGDGVELDDRDTKQPFSLVLASLALLLLPLPPLLVGIG